MALAVLQANLKDAASTPDGVAGFTQLYEGLQQKPAFLFLTEAYDESRGLDPGLQTWASANGYRMTHDLYRDDEKIHDRHGWVALAAAGLVVSEPEIIRLPGNEQERARRVGRTAVKVCMHDEESGQDIDIFGAHLSDRDPETNVTQAVALAAYADPDKPTAFVLQTNSMRRSGIRAAALRRAGHHFQDLPQADPGDAPPESLHTPEGQEWKPRRIASLATRLGGMAAGLSVGYLERQGFRSDHPLLQPATVHVGPVPIGKVDHIFVRNAGVRSAKPLKNILVRDMNGLRRVPHRVTVGSVYISRKHARAA